MTRRSVLIAAIACLLAAIVAPARHPRAQATDRPVVVMETSKGVLAFETFPNEAPVAVAHVLALVRARFYDGQRIHRAQPGFVVQFGDPQSRDLAKRELWGRGAAAASGKPVGVAELSTKHLHKAGAVGMAHMGDPSKADSQIYVTLEARPDLDGRYLVISQVIEGADVPSQLQVGDEIRRVYVR